MNKVKIIQANTSIDYHEILDRVKNFIYIVRTGYEAPNETVFSTKDLELSKELIDIIIMIKNKNHE